MQMRSWGLSNKFNSGNPVHEYGLAVSPDGHYLITGGTPDTPQRNSLAVTIWPTDGSARARQFTSEGIFPACAWSPDDRTVAVARLIKVGSRPRRLSERPVASYISELRILDAANMRTLSTLTRTDFLVRCLEFDQTGEYLALGGRRDTTDRLTKEQGRSVILRLSDGRVMLDVAHGDDVDAVAYIPGGKLLATDAGSPVGEDWGDQAIRLWEIRSGRLVRELTRSHAEAPCRISVSPDGLLLAAGDGPEGNVLLWDVPSGKAIASLASDSNTIYTTAFSPDGSLLATGSRDGKVRVWSVAARQLVKTFVGHTAPVHALAFCPDGQKLFSGETKTYDGLVCVWNVSAKNGGTPRC